MKKKNYSIYLRNAAVLAGCFGMLVSCNKEVALSTDTPVNDIPGAVRVLSLGIDALPDGEDAGSVPTTGKVGFFMAGDNGYTAFHNQPGEYTDGAWSPTDQLWLNNKEATLAVYYPYAASGTTKAEIPMAASLRTDAGKDISAAKFTTNSQTPISKITMTQIYSRLVIKVIKDSEYTGGDGQWTAVTLEGNEVYTSGAYNPITETYTGTQAKFVPEEFSKTLGTSASADDVASVDMLLIPDVDMTGLTIDLTVDTRPLQATIASLPEGRFAPGKVQTVILTVSSLGLIINQVTITDWEDVPGEDDYTVDALIPPGITVLAGDINLGGETCTDDDKAALSKLTWAPGNLRQAGDDGSGATIFAGATDYGHYYTWYSEYTGDPHSTETDPCATLDAATYGIGWRTPYNNELVKLARCTDGQLTSNDGVQGMWFMNKTKGLFLPGAGFRNGFDGSGTNADQVDGYYWSSNVDESDDAYYLEFTQTTVKVGPSYYNKWPGYSVRCVKGNPGLTVPASDINLGEECTADDKAALSKIAWARGNLKSSDNTKPYEWTTPTDYGYYYTWNSIYTGNTDRQGPDPCTLLDEAKYGLGWRTPSKQEFDMLARCSDKKLVSNNSVMGMWFMNNPEGLFLPAAGYRDSVLGSGTDVSDARDTYGNYWCSDADDSGCGYYLYCTSGIAYTYTDSNASGFSVRCVKGGEQ